MMNKNKGGNVFKKRRIEEQKQQQIPDFTSNPDLSR